MKKTLIALSILSSTIAFASGDVWLWKEGKYFKNEAIDSITFEDPISTINRQNEGSVPEVFMADNEFAADGVILGLKGKFYSSTIDSIAFPSVGFNVSNPNASGLDSVIWVTPEGFGEDWIQVEVPEGVKENTFIAVKNVSNGKIGFSQFRFRDTRNMLVDFDNNTDLCYSLGAIPRDANGNYNIANYIDDWVNSVPSNYYSGKGKKNQFGVFHNADDWESIMYVPDWKTQHNSIRSIFGSAFESQVMENPAIADDFVVKFELFVDSDYPTNYEVLTLGIDSIGKTNDSDYRRFSAAFQASEITWDKSDAEAGWMFSSAKNFTTEDDFTPKSGWMTITIPLSEFNWSPAYYNYMASAQYLAEGNYTSAPQEFFGDSKNHLSYAKYYADKLSSEQGLRDYFGSLAILLNPYDGPYNTSTTNKSAHVAIDNIRVVPNDGNGAIYPHFMYGKPSQHILLNPRTEAFTF